MSNLTYEDIHWGTECRYIEDVEILHSCSAKPVTELRAISYVTVKGGEPAVHRHEFKLIDGRGPYLLEAASSGRNLTRVPKVPQHVIAMGRVVDFETADKKVVLAPFYWIATTEADTELGGPVLLASRFRPAYAIEHRPNTGSNKGRSAPFVQEHGIID